MAASAYASGLSAAMLVAENDVSYAAGRLTRGALLQGMDGGDVPTLTAAANYSSAVADQLSGASGALAAGVGTGTVTYNITIDAKNVKEFNDIVRIAENERQDTRMGYVGG